MPEAFEIHFSVKEPVALLGLGGEALYGLTMNLLGLVDLTVARRLHQSPSPPPFALSPVLKLSEKAERRNQQTLLRENVVYRFFLSTLTPEMLELWIAGIHQVFKHRKPLFLGGVPFVLEKFHPRQAILYPDLVTFGRETAARRLAFHFLSPTTFRRDPDGVAQYRVFPTPEYVFSSLWTRWHLFSEVPLGSEPPDFSLIRVQRYQLRTVGVRFYGYQVIGFLGQVVYEVPPSLDEFRSLLVTLTAFAPYSGVGYHCAMGLGRVRTHWWE